MDFEQAQRALIAYELDVREAANLLKAAERRDAASQLNRHLRRVNPILANLTPDHSHIAATSISDHQPALPAAKRATELIEGSFRMAHLANLPDPLSIANLPEEPELHAIGPVPMALS